MCWKALVVFCSSSFLYNCSTTDERKYIILFCKNYYVNVSDLMNYGTMNILRDIEAPDLHCLFNTSLKRNLEIYI